MVDQVKAFLFSSIKEGLALPDEFIEFRLCRYFGWTPDQIDELEESKVQMYRRFIELEEETGMMRQSSSPHG